MRLVTGSSKGSPLHRTAASRRRALGKLGMPRGIPTLAGRKEGATYIIEVRCRTAEQASRIAERISQEVLGC